MQKDLAKTNAVVPFAYEDHLIRTVTLDNGEPGFVAADVAKVIEVQNVSVMIQNLNANEKVKTRLSTPGGIQELVVLTSFGLRKLLSKSRSPHAKSLALKLGFTEMIFPVKEQANLEIIIKAISGILAYKTQYYIDGYKIDLYLPEINLAVEIDENGHSNRNSDYEREREYHIAHELCCEIIRINPDEVGFNVGDIINLILRRACLQKVDRKQTLIPLKLIKGGAR